MALKSSPSLFLSPSWRLYEKIRSIKIINPIGNACHVRETLVSVAVAVSVSVCVAVAAAATAAKGAADVVCNLRVRVCV